MFSFSLLFENLFSTIQIYVVVVVFLQSIVIYFSLTKRYSIFLDVRDIDQKNSLILSYRSVMTSSTSNTEAQSQSTEQIAQQFLSNADEYFRTEMKCTFVEFKSRTN